MKGALAGAAAALALTTATSSHSSSYYLAFNLPAQEAVTAIPEFGRQAGLQIVAPADHLRGVRTPPLKGPMDVETALSRLIAGTGLEVARFEGHTILLRMRASPPPPPRVRVAAARPAAAVALPVAAIEVDSLVVFGGGQARQAEIVRGRDLAAAAPGSSPLRLVAKLPSVNLQSADPFGANEWSTRISVRNFNQDRLGFTLDDIPLGDMAHDNHNGLHVSRAITGENVGSVELIQGPGALEAASSSNLGGTLRFQSRDPDTEQGAYLVAGLGSDRAYRGVLRVETGALPSGLRAYASYAYNTNDRWQGAGRQAVEQVNVKAVQPMAGGTLTALIDLSRRRESDPQDLSLEMIHRLGLGWDNVPDDWALAVRLAEIGANRGDTPVTPHNPEAGTAYPAPISKVDDAYFDSATLRDDVLAGLTFRIPVAEKMDLRSTIYGHWDKGQDLWWTPHVPSPSYGVAGATRDNAPLSIRATEYDIRRGGWLGAATVRLGDHELSAGGWLEDNDFVQSRRFYGLDLAAPQRDNRRFQTGPFETEWSYHFSTRTRQGYVQDVWRLQPRLTLTAGFKALSVTNHAVTRAGPVKDGSIRARGPFLPRLGLGYRPNDRDELFANYGRGLRAFPSSNTSGPFATTQAAFQTMRSTLKPETSDSFEVGWRRNLSDVTLLAAIYDVRVHDRLVTIPVGQGIVGNPSVLANAGEVKIYGLETAVSWRLSPDWALFGSYAYSRAAYEYDVFDGDGVRIANTRGKSPVDAPKHMLKAHLDYDRQGFFAQLAVSYVGPRYFTFENDQRVSGQFLADIMAGYTFSGSALLDGLTAQVNVTNFFDNHYISTLGSNDFPVRGDAQTLLAGPPPQVFLTLRKAL